MLLAFETHFETEKVKKKEWYKPLTDFGKASPKVAIFTYILEGPCRTRTFKLYRGTEGVNHVTKSYCISTLQELCSTIGSFPENLSDDEAWNKWLAKKKEYEDFEFDEEIYLKRKIKLFQS